MMKALWGVAEFVAKNFATPIAFFLVYQKWGAKPAIAVAVGVALTQVVLHWGLRQRFSPFFIVATSFTVLFGTFDFFVSEPRYFRLEPFAENLFIGLLFLGATLAGKPIALWFAQALPPRFKPQFTEDLTGYLRKVTWIWIVYFFLKAFLFLYLAFQVDLGRLIVLRSLIGGVSLAALFGGEIFYRTRIRSKLMQAKGL